MNSIGLLGKNIQYSFSPPYFSEKWFREGIHGWTYGLFDLDEFPEDFHVWWKAQLNLIGINVTIPYKTRVFENIEPHNLSESARAIGAVNTVVLDPESGALYADNTDWSGFMESLDQEQILGSGRPALILGSGGASKAIQYALIQLGVDFAVVSRKTGANGIGYHQLENQLSEYGLIVNTTPLGGGDFSDQYPPIPYEEVTDQHYFFDLIYTPKMTHAMRMCSLRGAYVQNGSEMLIRQAEKAWEFWGKWYQ